MQRKEPKKEKATPPKEIPRWEIRNLHQSDADQKLKQKTNLSLYYSDLSIGPVLAISTDIDTTHKLKPFYTFKAPFIFAKYTQHLLVWSLTLTGNQNLAETALYNNLQEHEKIVQCWSPHFSFLVNGEATAIETKINTQKLLRLSESDLLKKISYFLKPIPNDPTKEQYTPPKRQGKRGKYDPGPVFGTSIDFLRNEFDIQKFFEE